MVDPRNLRKDKYLNNQNFVDQLAIADIVIANKTDQCQSADLAIFNHWFANQTPAKIASEWVTQGQVPVQLLDLPRSEPLLSAELTEHHHQEAQLEPQFALAPDKPFLRKENQGQGYFSCGWIFGAEVVFDFDDLLSIVTDLTAERVKGVLNTTGGCFALNVNHGVVSVNQMSLEGFESRLEVIDSQKLAWDQLETLLKKISNLDDQS